jgi:hypothetical protein
MWLRGGVDSNARLVRYTVMADDPRSIAISLASAALLASAGTLAKSARAQSHEWAAAAPRRPKPTTSSHGLRARHADGT